MAMIKTSELTPAELEQRVSILEAALAEPGRVPQEYHGQFRQLCAKFRHSQAISNGYSLTNREGGPIEQ